MHANTHPAPETKAETVEVAGALGTFVEAFEGYRDRSEERLAAIEKRMNEDGGGEVERLGRALEEQEKRIERLSHKQARPPLGGRGPERADERPSGRASTARPLRPMCAAATSSGCAAWRRRG